MRRTTVLPSLFAAFGASAVLAAPAEPVDDAPQACLAALEQVLRTQDTVQARFVLQKKAPGIRRMLESRGRVVVVPGRGLIWEVTEPFAALSVFGPGRIGRTDEAGEYAVHDAPQAAHVLEAVSKTEADALARDFFVDCRRQAAHLRAVISPRRSTYADFLTEAVIEADLKAGVITRLSLTQPSGAVSHITFSDQKRTAHPAGRDGALIEGVQ